MLPINLTMRDYRGSAHVLCFADMGRVNKEQAKILNRVVGEQLHYFNRLIPKMTAAGIDPDDQILRVAVQVADKLQHLFVETHYRSVGSGVGAPSADNPA